MKPYKALLTALCSLLLCFSSFAQNSPPYLVNDTVYMVNSSGGSSIYLSTPLADAESNPIHTQGLVIQPSHGLVQVLSPTLIVYKPNGYFYGFDSFSFVACDTVYNTQSSMCDVLVLYIQVDSPYLQVDTTLIHDTICIGSQYAHAIPVMTGGASHSISCSSSDPTDIVYESGDGFGNRFISVVKNNIFNSTIFLTIENFENGDTIGPFPFLQLHTADTITGTLVIDNSITNGISFIPDFVPAQYHYGLEWFDYDSTNFEYEYGWRQVAMVYDTIFAPFYWLPPFSPGRPGFKKLTVTDSLMGCVSTFWSAYDGINRGLEGNPPVQYSSTDAVNPFQIGYWWDYNVRDIDGDWFYYFDTLTQPQLGTVTWDSYGMKYTPRIDTCGIDSFYILTRDTSNFQPYSFIDTVLAIVNISCNKVALITVATPVSCSGDSNAVLAVSTNVMGVLTYNWSNGATTPSLTNVSAGQYWVTVTNQVNHSATAVINVNAPQALILTSTAQNISCYGGSNGRIINTATGGVSPYTYSLNGGPLVSGSFTQLLEGYYFVMVSDGNGCTDTATYFINEPDSLIASVIATPTCGASCSGVGTVSPQGGTPPYSYTWSNNQQGATINNLCAGSTYSITVRDSKFCSVTTSVSVTQGINPLTLSFTEQHIDCNNLTGSLTAIPANGATPYTYSWSNGSTAQTATNLAAGTYNVQLYDANGCIAIGSDSVLNISGLTGALLNSTAPTCLGSQNGAARITVNGGLPPYSYVWQGNSSTADTASNLGVGPNTVTISDATGCNSNFIFTLTPQSAITLNDSIVHKHCINYQKGEIIARAENGIPPYAYNWSNSGYTGSYLTNLNAGYYSYTVTDAYGCTANNAINVWNYSLFLSANATTENCGFNNATIKLKGYNGTPPYVYTWNTNPPFIGDSIGNLSAGAYPFVVTDSLGCKRTGTKVIANSCYSTIAGNVFYDTNGDCIRDSGEVAFNMQLVARATNGFDFYYSNVDGNGGYNIRVPQTGNYQVSLVYKECYIICSGGTANVLVTVMDSMYIGPDIGVRVDPNSFDLAVSAWGGTPNPGFNNTYSISVTRMVDIAPTTGVVTFVYDNNLTYVSTTPPAIVNTATHTITWNVNNIPLATNAALLQAEFYVSVSASPGETYACVATIQPTANDCNPQNNIAHVANQVAGAYDPNMKEAYPSAEILETDSGINYTIHFQNTGTDTTHFIILKDTLSDLVDPGSVEFLGSSHQPCRYELSENGILTFTFDPIYLPDSATNEEGSKGFVSYSIKKKADAPVGEVIRNTAHIYFDFNPAIVTNTTENEVTTLVSIRDVKANGSLTAKVYPNPFNETATIELSEKLTDGKLVIANLAGQVVQQYNSENGSKWLINKQGLSQGMYTFTVYSGGIVKIRGKLIAE